ncbi:MAG: hypothetical protein DMD66_02035 [Gemmatimonadetes bacterium]|nr:MAG: hypothetical protein DMD66_02035 [Gemmatimonadota bacterium]
MLVVEALREYLQRTKAGHAAISPADLTPEPGALVQPDAFVVGLVAGVPEYWIIDLEARLVERWRPGDERPEILTEQEIAPLTIDLAAFFGRVFDSAP